MHDRALTLLKDAGLSGYEAKAYLALLASSGPLNGYEVAKQSGVPRSTVYETLSKLVHRGAAFEVSSRNGTAYVALPADALVGRLRRDLDRTVEGLAEALPKVSTSPDTRVVQHVHGGASIAERAIDVIDRATAALWLSVWPDHLPRVSAAVRRATQRGVDVSAIVFGDPGDLAGRVHVHRYSSPEVVLDRMGWRVFAVVADHDEVLLGAADGDHEWALWSDDPAVAMIAAEYVRHDIALQLIGDKLAEAGMGDFWEHDAELEHLRSAAAMVSLRALAHDSA